MCDDRHARWRLQAIKSHIDAHGIGCAIVNDHIAIGLLGGNADEACGCPCVKRVKSLDEARKVIGCCCADKE